MNTALGGAAVVGVVILVFYVFLAFRIRRGANWARIVTFVIAGLGILGALISFGQPDPPLSRALGIVVGAHRRRGRGAVGQQLRATASSGIGEPH